MSFTIQVMYPFLKKIDLKLRYLEKIVGQISGCEQTMNQGQLTFLRDCSSDGTGDWLRS